MLLVIASILILIFQFIDWWLMRRMKGQPLSRHPFWHVEWQRFAMAHTTYLLLSLLTTIYSQPYRTFPQLSNLVRERPVNTTPPDSICGTPARSTYCRSTTSPNSVADCIQDYCDQACPLRYELPLHSDLLDASNYDVCVTKDTINVGTKLTSYSALFTGGYFCLVRCVTRVPDSLLARHKD